MALRQISNRTYSGNTADLPVNLPAGSIFVDEENPAIYVAKQDESLKKIGIDLKGYFESGTRSGGDLEVIIGDYDDSNNGVKITINDNTGEINIGKTVLISNGYYMYNGGGGLILGDVEGDEGGARLEFNLDTSLLARFIGKVEFTENAVFKESQNFFFNGSNRLTLSANNVTQNLLLEFCDKGGTLPSLNLSSAPSSSSDVGKKGEVRYDANYVYICTDDNTWIRLDIATW